MISGKLLHLLLKPSSKAMCQSSSELKKKKNRIFWLLLPWRFDSFSQLTGNDSKQSFCKTRVMMMLQTFWKWKPKSGSQTYASWLLQPSPKAILEWDRVSPDSSVYPLMTPPTPTTITTTIPLFNIHSNPLLSSALSVPSLLLWLRSSHS